MVSGSGQVTGHFYCTGSICGTLYKVLVDDCQLVADARVRQLRSADTRSLVVSRTCSGFGDRTFAAAGPQVATSLPRAARSQTMWAVIRPVQAVTEDIFIRTVRPRRTVNYF